jgi:hypothetical protein
MEHLMNPERKAELLAALRTPPSEGGYLQCRDQLTTRMDLGYDPITDTFLKDVDTFCCLGVATNLAVIAGVVRWDEVATNGPADTSMVQSLTAYSEKDAKFHNDRKKALGCKTKVRRFEAGQHDDDRQNETIWQVYSETYENASMPGVEVLEYFGMDNETASELARMNDKGKSFTQIADWIEVYR